MSRQKYKNKYPPVTPFAAKKCGREEAIVPTNARVSSGSLGQSMTGKSSAKTEARENSRRTSVGPFGGTNIVYQKNSHKSR
jgi:hypothetical protein